MEMKYQAVILGKRDIAETDRLYWLYTKEAGKILLTAKGVRKPSAKLAGHLETASLAEIFVSKSRGRGRITGVFPIDVFPRLKTDYDFLSRVFYAFSTFEKIITSDESDEKIFNLLVSFLGAMEKEVQREAGNPELITTGFIFKLLAEAGYQVLMDRCAVCGRTLLSGDNFFESSRGGVVCSRCVGTGKRIRLADGAIKLARIFLKNRVENFSKIRASKKDLDNLKIVLEDLLAWVG